MKLLLTEGPDSETSLVISPETTDDVREVAAIWGKICERDDVPDGYCLRNAEHSLRLDLGDPDLVGDDGEQ